MNSLSADTDIKRVGRSGQISIGKQHAGRYFREHREDDGSIVLIPVVVVPASHWTVRDEAKIRKALAWAAENPPKETELESLLSRPRRGARRSKREK